MGIDAASGPAVRRVLSPRVRAIRHYRSANGLPVESPAAAEEASVPVPVAVAQPINSLTPTRTPPSSAQLVLNSSSSRAAVRDLLDMQAQEQIELNRAILMSLDSVSPVIPAAAAAAGVDAVAPDEESLQLLESMGFNREAAAQALRSVSNHVDSAINALLSAP